mmetsp:Transcript_18655/g.50595  ORF Transcript_18655/g.50595 Transcript_18655/m.50595 type:complete len:749 (+) Transcript_18655:2-2248(+)
MHGLPEGGPSLPQAEEADAGEGGVVEGPAALLQQRRRVVAGDVLLRAHEALHLRCALRRALREGADDPVAVRRDPRLVVLLVLEVGLVGGHVDVLVVLVLRALADHVTQVHLLGLELALEPVRRGELPLELELGELLGLHAVLDLVVQVLHDHAQELDDALGLVPPVALAGEDGLRRLILGDIKVRPLLREGEALHVALDRPELDRVVAVVRGQRRLRLGQQLDGVLILGLGVQEGGVLFLALLLHGGDLSLDLLDLIDGLDLLVGELLDDALKLVDGSLVLLDEPLDVGDGAVGLRVLLLALVALRDVRRILVPERRDHGVDGLQDFVKVADLRLLDPHRERRQAQAAGAPRRAAELRVRVLRRCGAAVDLEEGDELVDARAVRLVHARLLALLDGRGEELARRVRGQDLDRLLDAAELLGPQLAARGPLGVLGAAGRLRLVEERNVRLHLALRVVVALRGVREELLGLGLEALLLRLQALHREELLGLVGDKVLELPVPLGLRLRRRLEVCGEGVVHVAQDALHRPALRRVLAAVARLDKLAQERRVLRLQRDGGGQGLDHGPHCVAGGRALLQERRGLGALAEDNDGLLQRSQDLLHLSGLRHVDPVLLLPDGRGLSLRVLVGLDVLREPLDLRGERFHLALGLQHCLAELAQLVLGVGDDARLPRRGLLAPTRVLVVDLGLNLPVLLNLGLQILEEVDNLLHRRLLPLAPAGGAGRQARGREAEGEGVALHLRGKARGGAGIDN